jgi:hypothetical protein
MASYLFVNLSRQLNVNGYSIPVNANEDYMPEITLRPLSIVNLIPEFEG